MDSLDPEPLLRFLHRRGVDHILIGGVAVAAHGYRRPSKDLDMVPDDLYHELDREALRFELDDVPARYCSLRHLRAMKVAAGRPRNLDDLQHLPSE